MPSVEELFGITLATMQAGEFCFLLTEAEQEPQKINARLMQPFAPEEDLTIWFGASPYSRKANDIRQNNQVTVAYQHADEAAYVVLQGTAELVEDVGLRRQYWREAWEPFWPQGPGGDDYILIKFTPARIELMNLGRNVAPKPYGLQPAVLARIGDTWQVVTA